MPADQARPVAWGSVFDDSEVVRDLGRLAEHDGGRAATRWARSAGCGSAKQAANRSGFLNLEIVRDLGGLAEHDRGRAVFLGGQMHGLFDALGVQRFSGDGEVNVDLGEHLGVAVGARGGKVGDAVGDLLATLTHCVAEVEGPECCQRPD